MIFSTFFRLFSIFFLVFSGFVFNANGDEKKQIFYNYKTELVCNGYSGVELPESFEAMAKKKHADLNESACFKTSFVRDVQAVREWHLSQSNPDRGQLISVMTEDGVEIKCTYFDRGSENLVIVGEGFTNEREIMTPFVKMFENYDVVLFDFRGHGFDPAIWKDPGSWMTFNLAKNTFGMDSRASKLGEVEERDVQAVVQGFRALKNYKNVLGVSVCYGSFIFLKAEAMFPGLFDKIVVDGCWDSLAKLISKLRHDLKLLCKPQTGGWKEYWISQQPWFQSTMEWLTRNVWRLNIDHDVRLSDYLPNVKKTPVLFFYGKDDLMVYREEFEELWGSLSTPYRIAVVTSNPHVMNQYKQKELYKEICETFFACDDVDSFKNKILDFSENKNTHDIVLSASKI